MLSIATDTATSAVYVHPAAICESPHVGEGTRVWPFAHVLDGAIIGRCCNIGEQAYVEGGSRIGDRVVVKNQVMIWEGVTIEDEVFLGPGMIFTNDRFPRSRGLKEAAGRYADTEHWLTETTVRRGASIGAGAIVLAGVTIGRYASVGAGAVVTRDVPDHRIVVGNPARQVGWACICGLSLNEHLCCPSCQRRFDIRDNALRMQTFGE